MEASDKSIAVAVIEHVEQATIQHGVVPFYYAIPAQGHRPRGGGGRGFALGPSPLRDGWPSVMSRSP